MVAERAPVVQDRQGTLQALDCVRRIQPGTHLFDRQVLEAGF
jgi:hypothetical protein